MEKLYYTGNIKKRERENKFVFSFAPLRSWYIICVCRNIVTVHSVTSNTLRDAQKSCIRMISRRNSRVFCELCSQKTPRGMLPVNSNIKITFLINRDDVIMK